MNNDVEARTQYARLVYEHSTAVQWSRNGILKEDRLMWSRRAFEIWHKIEALKNKHWGGHAPK